RRDRQRRTDVYLTLIPESRGFRLSPEDRALQSHFRRNAEATRVVRALRTHGSCAQAGWMTPPAFCFVLLAVMRASCTALCRQSMAGRGRDIADADRRTLEGRRHAGAVRVVPRLGRVRGISRHRMGFSCPRRSAIVREDFAGGISERSELADDPSQAEQLPARIR